MNIAYKLIKIADKTLNYILYIILAIAFLFCLYALFDSIKIYTRANSDAVANLKPSRTNPKESFEALLKINKDVRAWITIDNTNIDYPVVQGESNADYLSKDVYGNYAVSGSIFLDYRNDKHFNDLYTIIFGHHMNGGAMFGDIQKFVNSDFFNKRRTGTLYTMDGVYSLEVVAFLNTDAYNPKIYAINKNNVNAQQKLVNYIKENAVHFNDIGLTGEDKLICLSTCSTATTNGRDILILRVKK